MMCVGVYPPQWLEKSGNVNTKWARFQTIIFFYICLSHRTLLLLLSMNLQQLNELCCWMEWLRLKKKKKTVITFLALRIQKKE